MTLGYDLGVAGEQAAFEAFSALCDEFDLLVFRAVGDNKDWDRYGVDLIVVSDREPLWVQVKTSAKGGQNFRAKHDIQTQAREIVVGHLGRNL